MRLQTIVYVSPMHRSADWYTNTLGVAPTVESKHWTSFSVGDATTALHLADELAPQLWS